MIALQKTICSASTVDKELKEKSEKLPSDCNSSSIVGKLLAKRAIKKRYKASNFLTVEVIYITAE